jgi:hypothetical protein
MRFRKLRIAWSVACGIACVLLIALWVRSFWWWDTVGIVYGDSLISSLQGRVYVDGVVNADNVTTEISKPINSLEKNLAFFA